MSERLFEDSLSLLEQTWLVLRALHDYLRCPDTRAKGRLNKSLGIWQEEWVRHHALDDGSNSKTVVMASTQRFIGRLDGFTRELTDETAWQPYPCDPETAERLKLMRLWLQPPSDSRDPPWEEEEKETPGGTGV